MTDKEKGKILIKISRFFDINMKAEIKLLTTQTYFLETDLPKSLSQKFDLVILDVKQNIVLAMDIDMSNSKQGLSIEKGFERSLPFAYGLINKDLDFNILNPVKLPFDKTWGDIKFLVELLKMHSPSLKTESEQIIEQMQQSFQVKQFELEETKKQIDKLKNDLIFQEEMSSERYRDALNLREKEKKQQQYNFNDCEFKEQMIIARAKLDLPKRTGTETSITLPDGSMYSNEKSTSNDVFDFKLRFEFGFWILKISFLGRHEEFGYGLIERGVAFYSYDESRNEFIPLIKEKEQLLGSEQTWILWERVVNG